MVSTWLIAGGGGMLAADLRPRLEALGSNVIALGRAELDVTDAGAAASAVARHRPDVVVNCAAWTAVDDAEEHEPEALTVNCEGPRHLAAACKANGAFMIQISTDYVFGGDATAPYSETAPTAPLNAYGRTKEAGERAVLELLPETGYVVRTAWLYGAGGPNFVRTMIRLEAVKDALDVVDDQRGQPTWTGDLADRVIRLGQGAIRGTAPAGVYHGTNAGETTWFGLTRRIFELLGSDPERVRPTTSEAFRRPAVRPAYSLLGHDRWKEAGMEPMRDWDEALTVAFASLSAAERGGAGR